MHILLLNLRLKSESRSASVEKQAARRGLVFLFLLIYSFTSDQQETWMSLYLNRKINPDRAQIDLIPFSTWLKESNIRKKKSNGRYVCKWIFLLLFSAKD